MTIAVMLVSFMDLLAVRQRNVYELKQGNHFVLGTSDY